MQNPYAHSTGPGPATAEDQLRADYELAIGQNAEYYIPRFEEFDKGASKLGWHWPAFFATTPWFLYRKMWGWGLGNIAYFWGMLTFVGPVALAVAIGSAGKGNEMGATIKVGVVLLLLMAIPWFVLPMFANALYWKQINKVIRGIPKNIQQQPDKRVARIRRNGGTGPGAMIGVLVGGALVIVVFGGIWAAIAIPAYQDYTIRSQVNEGLKLADAPKAAVAEYYAQNGSWPVDAEVAGLRPIGSNFVESVTVANGSVVITFGGRAARNIVSKRLLIAPGLTEHQEIIWTCGDHAVPGNVVSMGPGPSGSDLPAKYLPVYCRP